MLPVFRIAIYFLKGTLTFLLFVGLTGNHLFAQSTNSIRIRTPNREIQATSKLDQLSSNKDSVQILVQHTDGISRPLQNVLMKASPGANDIVQPIAYDQFGRPSKKYLSYAVSSANLSDGSYKADALVSGQGLMNFYNPQGSSGTQQTTGIVRTASPYSVAGFELSSLNRVVEQGSPGDTWQFSGPGSSTSSARTIKIAYSTNDQTIFNGTTLVNNPGSHKVAFFTAGINSNQSRSLSRVSNTATYANGKLYLKIKKDENWQPNDGCLGTKEEYKDQEGHLVLERTYNLRGGSLEMISVYYVYDDFGNLCFVLPQASNPDAATPISPSTLDAFCYQYRYDERNRMTQKKQPGKGWEYIIYNKLNQSVASQDSVQRMKGPQQWTIMKYDALGRLIISGIYEHPGSTPGTNMRSTIQGLVDGQAIQWETPVTTGNGYTANTWPASWLSTLLINYYDNYTSIPGLPAVYDKHTDLTYSQMTTGLLTASKVGVLNNSDMLWRVSYYDDRSRIIKVFKQHYLGGNGAISQYNFNESTLSYNFSGQIVKDVNKHYLKNSGNTAALITLTVTNDYTYDHMGREIKTSQQLQDGVATAQAQIVISQNEYNEIGQLKAKKLHSINNGTSFLQTIDYRYNPRNWLSSINNSNLTTDGGLTNSDVKDQFGIELFYESTTTASPQFNGQIATAKWKSGAVASVAQPQYSYDYKYDRLGQLTEAVSSTGSTKDKYFSEYLSYNTMGNISALGRYDKVAGVLTKIDSLTYSYDGNHYSRIDDAAVYTGNLGFVDVVKVNSEYTYDGNGNVKKDLNRSITNIDYNILNMPQIITINGNSIAYTYDASGTLLRKVFTSGANVVTSDYVDGIQYTNGVIEFLQTQEGKARKNGTVYIYEYDLKDHLGNTRVTIKADPADLSQTTPLVLQQNSYYAFGGIIKSLEPIVTSPKNNYLYNNKELQVETGLYNYGARFYDPFIAKWTTSDPLAEKYTAISPYAYVANNPINFTDPDGRRIDVGSLSEWQGAFGKATAIRDQYLSAIEQIKSDALKNGTSDGKLATAMAPLIDGLNSAKAMIEQLNMMASSLNVYAYSGGSWSVISNGAEQGAIFVGGAFLATGWSITGGDPEPFSKAAGAIIMTGYSAYVLYQNRTYLANSAEALYNKMAAEIDRIAKKTAGPQGFQYALRANHSGLYPNVRGGTVFLNVGDVWKYGETTSSSRYSNNYLESMGLEMDRQFPGNQVEIKIQEKIMIYGYFMQNGTLPPGNLIFR